MSERCKLTRRSPEVQDVLEQAQSSYSDCIIFHERPVLFYKLYTDAALTRTDKSEARKACVEIDCPFYAVVGEAACTLVPRPEGNSVYTPTPNCFLRTNRPRLHAKISAAKNRDELADPEITRARRDCQYCGRQDSCTEVYQKVAYERHDDRNKYEPKGN